MEGTLDENLRKYYDKFETPFPLMQAPGDMQEAEKHVVKCLEENKLAEELWPERYGAVEGRLV